MKEKDIPDIPDDIDPKHVKMWEAFKTYLEDPGQTNKEIASKIGVHFNSVAGYRKHDTWKKWIDKYCYETKNYLIIRMRKLADGALDYFDDMFNGRLDKEMIRASNGAAKVLDQVLEMNGLIKQRPGIIYNNYNEINEINNFNTADIMVNYAHLFTSIELKETMLTNELPQRIVKLLKEEEVKVKELVEIENNDPRNVLPS